MSDKRPKPPAHLSDEMRAFFKRVVRDFALSEHHFKLLTAGCEAHDRMSAARALLERDGLTVSNRFAATVPPPLRRIGRSRNGRSRHLEPERAHRHDHHL